MPAISTAKRPDKEWPPDGLESVPNCPVCRSSRRQLVHTELHDGIFRCAPGHWNFYRCEDCHSGWLDPRPTPSTIALAYQQYYTHAQGGGTRTQSVSGWRRFRIAQRNSYLNANYGYSLEPAAWSPIFLSEARRRRFDAFTGYLRFPGAGARVLDIGCGNGTFLWQMRSLGWEVCGVEPDPQSAAHAQSAGLDVRVGLLQQQSCRKQALTRLRRFMSLNICMIRWRHCDCCFQTAQARWTPHPGHPQPRFVRLSALWAVLAGTGSAAASGACSRRIPCVRCLEDLWVCRVTSTASLPHRAAFFKKSLIVELGGDPVERLRASALVRRVSKWNGLPQRPIVPRGKILRAEELILTRQKEPA